MTDGEQVSTEACSVYLRWCSFHYLADLEKKISWAFFVAPSRCGGDWIELSIIWGD